jgi:integrase
MALTARQVAVQTGRGLYGDGHGLYLRIGPTGAKSWVLRFQLARRRRDTGLGSVELVSLADARDKAHQLRRALKLERVDPIEAKRKAALQSAVDAAKAMTFQHCAEAYIATHRAGWQSSKHLQQWSNTLAAYVYPHFGRVPVQAVDVGLIMKVIEPVWSTKPETASRVRGRIENVLDWATVRGYRTGDNPARWRGHLESLLPRKTKVRAVEHHAALPYSEIAAFIAELRRQKGLAARALEFAILTVARTGEVHGATWREIDFKVRTWTIPGNRMKAGREHRVPLSAPVLALLEVMPCGTADDRLFPLSNMALLMTLRRMKRADLTTHGFRSTFSDWCAESTDFASEVREMALAHSVGDKVEQAYRRGDLLTKRIQLAEDWARCCTGAQQG